LLLKIYQEQVEQKHLQHDPAQLSVLQHLQNLQNSLLEHLQYEQKSRLQKLLSPSPTECKSVYIQGDVGRGKSMLMDLFYEACPVEQKRRVHFHAFMLEVHEFVHDWRKQKSEGDMILSLAEKIRASTLLLCFDEFHVTDIADAMILGRLFTQLFASGLVVVITSNRHPNKLYQGGLQRDLFVPFINLLLDVCVTLNLEAKEDYRLKHLHALKTRYYFPIDAQANAFIQNSYDELTAFAVKEPGKICVKGREIILTAVHGDVALSSFSELCEQPLGSADYLELASEFTTLIIANIPKLNASKRNEAKRFSTLIDAVYEHKVNLISTAEVSPQKLYVEGDGAFEFARTVSRLIEMQSEKYLKMTHIID
jgi:cell division protein ZapE